MFGPGIENFEGTILVTKHATAAVTEKRINSTSPISLPKDADGILRLDGVEIWLFDPPRSTYKIYSSNPEIIRALQTAPKKFGVKSGATYSKNGNVFAQDFMVRFAEMQGVLELVQQVSNREE